MSENIPNYTQSGWKLNELFESFTDPAINQTYQDLETRVGKVCQPTRRVKARDQQRKIHAIGT